jgi:dipeptidyl aminopeptidase/acylaminoacyl peptidase
MTDLLTPPRPPELDELEPVRQPPAVDPEALIEEARRRARRRRLRWAGAVSLVLGVGAALSVGLRAGSDAAIVEAASDSSPASGTPQEALPAELTYTAGGIWIVRRDGSRRLLANHPAGLSGLAWSPDGSKLLAFRAGAVPSLVLVDPDGRVSAPVAKGASTGAWSPDGSRIAFVRAERGVRSLFVATLDGVGARRVATPVRDGYGLEFSWSPDGGRLVYSAPSGLHIVRADGRGVPRPILARAAGMPARPGVRGLNPRWSPDGTKIAVSRAGHPYVMNVDGTSLRAIAPHAGHATWSPDGRHLALLGGTRATGTAPIIWVVRPDGLGLQRIAVCRCALRGPGFWPSVSWSPDGSRLAYISGAGRGVSTVASDGSGATRVATQQNGLPLQPIWRPASG